MYSSHSREEHKSRFVFFSKVVDRDFVYVGAAFYLRQFRLPSFTFPRHNDNCDIFALRIKITTFYYWPLTKFFIIRTKLFWHLVAEKTNEVVILVNNITRINYMLVKHCSHSQNSFIWLFWPVTYYLNFVRLKNKTKAVFCASTIFTICKCFAVFEHINL